MHDLGAAIHDLRGVMRRFANGPHHGLAVAAGLPEAVEHAAWCLDAAQIERGTFGPNTSPDAVWNRVEALAAGAPQRLVEVATGWLPPPEIQRCTGPVKDWWSAAWWSALRHLEALGRVDRARAGVPELALECEVLWSDHAEPVTWEGVRAQVEASQAPFRRLRLAARAPLADTTITAAALERGPLILLRLLRGRFDRLEAGARARLDAWLADALGRHGLDVALLVEAALALELPGLTAFVPAFTARLAAEPEMWRGAAYTLATDWRVP